MSDKSKIYIFCPADTVTGGTELLHQLADTLISINKEAYVIYTKNNNIINQVIPEPFKKYNIKTTVKPDFKDENIFIVPETAIYLLNNIPKGKKMIWWLSVDNFFLCKSCTAFSYFYFIYKNKLSALFHLCKQYIGDIIKKREHLLFQNVRLNKLEKTIIHLYQSEYARDFLKKRGFKKLFPLKDYINDDYIDNNNSYNKKNIVIYNPKKGFDFTKQLIAKNSSINWLPIQNMNRQQVKDAMKSSKIYIDFGNHPGMDRMPREAALCGCCIITGKNGSAKYFEDVPISNDYKFSQNKNTINEIINKIIYIFSNYENVQHDFELYRKFISVQKTTFIQNVKEIFTN